MVSKFWVLGLCGWTTFALAAGAALAQSTDDRPESPIHALARVSGLATEPPPPPDFVKESRPGAPTGWSPVFKPYDEPGSKVKSKGDLKAMSDDLQKTGENADKLRADAEPGATPSPSPTAAAKRPKKVAAPKPTPSATSPN